MKQEGDPCPALTLSVVVSGVHITPYGRTTVSPMALQHAGIKESGGHKQVIIRYSRRLGGHCCMMASFVLSCKSALARTPRAHNFGTARPLPAAAG